MRVRLQSVRARVMEIYSSVVRPLLPDPELVRYWTPAETSEAVARRAAALREGLAALTRLTEQVYYDPDIPEPEMVAQAESLAHSTGETAQQIAEQEEEEAARRDSVLEKPLR
jgi:hypothetical protein